MFIINKTEVTRCEIFTPSERRLFAFSGAASDPLPSGAERLEKRLCCGQPGKTRCPERAGAVCAQGEDGHSPGGPQLLRAPRVLL